MSRIVFSRVAREDRRAITRYTVEHFGIHQARRLRRKFEAKLNLLADAPGMGRFNEQLDPPGHRFRYAVVSESFIVVYLPTEDGIRVARLLHGARDVAAELDDEAGEDT